MEADPMYNSSDKEDGELSDGWYSEDEVYVPIKRPPEIIREQYSRIHYNNAFSFTGTSLRPPAPLVGTFRAWTGILEQQARIEAYTHNGIDGVRTVVNPGRIRMECYRQMNLPIRVKPKPPVILGLPPELQKKMYGSQEGKPQTKKRSTFTPRTPYSVPIKKEPKYSPRQESSKEPKYSPRPESLKEPAKKHDRYPVKIERRSPPDDWDEPKVKTESRSPVEDWEKPDETVKTQQSIEEDWENPCTESTTQTNVAIKEERQSPTDDWEEPQNKPAQNFDWEEPQETAADDNLDTKTTNFDWEEPEEPPKKSPQKPTPQNFDWEEQKQEPVAQNFDWEEPTETEDKCPVKTENRCSLDWEEPDETENKNPVKEERRNRQRSDNGPPFKNENKYSSGANNRYPIKTEGGYSSRQDGRFPVRNDGRYGPRADGLPPRVDSRVQFKNGGRLPPFGTPVLLPKLYIAPDDTNSDIVKKLARNLKEKNLSLLERVVDILDRGRIIRFYLETHRTEQNGGLLILNNKRRRTSGGVYLFLIKIANNVTDRDKFRIFGEDLREMLEARQAGTGMKFFGHRRRDLDVPNNNHVKVEKKRENNFEKKRENNFEKKRETDSEKKPDNGFASDIEDWDDVPSNHNESLSDVSDWNGVSCKLESAKLNNHPQKGSPQKLQSNASTTFEDEKVPDSKANCSFGSDINSDRLVDDVLDIGGEYDMDWD